MAVVVPPRPAGPKPAGARMAPPRHKDENELNINDEIRATQVRLVGDNIAEPGVYSIAQAMKNATKKNPLESQYADLAEKLD